MEDGAATGFVQRGVAGAPDRASFIEMGGELLDEEGGEGDRAAFELHVGFSSGTSIRVPPIPMFESWQVQGPTGELWVGLPGGGVGVWPANRDGSHEGSTR